MKRKMMWAAVLLLPLLVVMAFAVMSLTSQRPTTLGVRDERLAACPDSPNCVSTQADRETQRMDSIPLTTDVAEAVSAIKRVVSAMPRCQIITADEHYLHAEFTSALFRFVDDVEFFIDVEQRVIHIRSASRVGHSDFGVNRQRMQTIVKQFQAAVADQPDPKTDR